MENLFTYSLTVFVSFFAIMNPIANTPIFLGLTEGMPETNKKNMARMATSTCFIIVFSFIILGKYVFELFGISISSFKITGGILIFYVGFEMLISQKSKIHNNDTEVVKSIAISPLAIPILAGPGTIVTAMNLVTKADGFTHVLVVTLVFALMCFLTYLTFCSSNWIVKKVGHNLISVIGKLMGLILAIIGTGMVVEGIQLAFFK